MKNSKASNWHKRIETARRVFQHSTGFFIPKPAIGINGLKLSDTALLSAAAEDSKASNWHKRIETRLVRRGVCRFLYSKASNWHKRIETTVEC